MESKPFLKPRVTGARFEGGAIPLEVLADLSVLSEMVVEVAKWKVKEEEPGRQRAPRGFTDGISLRLTAVESGSAVPVISLFVAAGALLPNPSVVYYEGARDAIIGAIGAAEHGERITKHLPERLLEAFNRFGRHLNDGEAIEFIEPISNKPVQLTKETRRRLILASSAEEVTDETSVVGLVHEFDHRTRSFELTLPSGTLNRIPVESQHYETLLEAFNGFQKKIRVRVSGIGLFGRDGRLQGIENVEDVTILDPLDIGERVEELRKLPKGWLDGEGEALNQDGLSWLGKSFNKYYPGDLVLPCLYPTPEGRVLAEWSLLPWSPSLEIELESQSGEWHELNIDTNAEDWLTVDLAKSNGWQWIANRIVEMGGKAQ